MESIAFGPDIGGRAGFASSAPVSQLEEVVVARTEPSSSYAATRAPVRKAAESAAAGASAAPPKEAAAQRSAANRVTMRRVSCPVR